MPCKLANPERFIKLACNNQIKRRKLSGICRIRIPVKMSEPHNQMCGSDYNGENDVVCLITS